MQKLDTKEMTMAGAVPFGGKTLIIAEKPSVGRAIAAVVGAAEEYPGYLEGERYVVSWCNGHLLSMAPPEWFEDTQLPILPKQWRLIPNKQNSTQLWTLCSLLRRRNITSVINACDNDREGDLIFANLMEFDGSALPAKRMLLRTATEEDIRRALKDLLPLEEFAGRTAAARCRSRADWLLAVNVSRMCFAGVEDPPFLGRTQLAALGIIARRYDEVRKHRGEESWQVTLTTADGHTMTSGAMDEEDARLACERAPGSIAEVKWMGKDIKEVSFTPYNLTDLQAEAGARMGLSGEQILEILQGLYRRGLITYPRTESRAIPRELLPGVQEALFRIVGRAPGDTRGEACWEQWADADTICCRKQEGPHPAILLQPDISPKAVIRSTPEEKFLLALIALQLLKAMILPDRYLTVEVLLECAGRHYHMTKKYSQYTVSSICMDIPGHGFVSELRWSDEEDEEFGGLVTDARMSSCGPAVKPYTEEELLQEMDDRIGHTYVIGTPGTRGKIIRKLLSNRYIRNQNGHLIPTERGLWILHRVPEDLTDKEFTLTMEACLVQVEKGKLTPEEFMKAAEKMIIRIQQQASALPPVPKDRVVGTCPVCGKDVVEGDRNYHCADRHCRFVLWKVPFDLRPFGVTVSRRMAEELLVSRECRMEEGTSPGDKNRVLRLYLLEDGTPELELHEPDPDEPAA